ncbi:MAG: bacillithiol biosynthesis BshC [Candidatus Thorarchaeota archaeon]|nr:bacillithiol biosynthesis BshC [Candidatus Thorarchaeota archaeon]
MKPSVTSVYQEFIWEGTQRDLAADLYGSPIVTMGEIVLEFPKILAEYKDRLWHTEERMKLLRKTLVKANRELTCLTPSVKENIEQLSNGVVEAAHQSVVMGGPAYILNKAITAERISSFSVQQGFDAVPVFFVADYDIVQSELTNIRTPNMGHDGNLLSLPVPRGYEHSPVSVLPLPEIGWYNAIQESLRSSYRPFLKPLEKPVQTLFEERLEQALAITRWGFVNSKTLGDWAQKIIGRLLNIEGNLGIPIIPASDEVFRDLMVTGMEFLLAKKQRDGFLKAHEKATDLIVKNGFRPGAGSRKSDYVPFYYECPEKECNRSRTELFYEEKGTKAVLTGKCPSCGQNVDIETPTNTPSLGDVGRYLSPRVDSRQLIVDTVLPIVAHVGGGGETAYYAQVIPIAKALPAPFPAFLKYPRVYFNTPWNESLAGVLKERGLPTLHKPDMFRLMGKANRFRKKAKHDEMNESIRSLLSVILESHKALNVSLKDLRRQRKTTTGDELKQLLTDILDIERYLSWAFGQYAENKLGQEASWSWIEWMLNSGVHDLFGPYRRAYVPNMKNGATLFVNFSV